MQDQPAEFSRALRLGDEIASAPVRQLYKRYVRLVSGMHDEIEARASAVEVRLFFRSELVCRLVPYRELFHVQVGDGQAWETRVRSEESFLDTMDRTLQRFLALRTSSETA